MNEEDYEKDGKDKNMEDRRLVFDGVLVAIFVAVISMEVPVLVKFIVGMPAFFAAIYLIMSASRVKYHGVGNIYAVPMSEKLRRAMYDWSVDFLGAEAICLFGILIIAIFRFFGISCLYDFVLWLENFQVLGFLINIIFVLAIGVVPIWMYFFVRKLRMRKKKHSDSNK